jgi:hypothetical protein
VPGGNESRIQITSFGLIPPLVDPFSLRIHPQAVDFLAGAGIMVPSDYVFGAVAFVPAPSSILLLVSVGFMFVALTALRRRHVGAPDVAGYRF